MYIHLNNTPYKSIRTIKEPLQADVVKMKCFPTGCEKFRYMCRRYHDEIDLIESIYPYQSMGVIHINLKNFAEVCLPEAKRLLELLEITLPW